MLDVKKSSQTKQPDEPYVIPADASEEVCLSRTTLAFPALPFDLQDARTHLCGVDRRFEPLFQKVPVRCYEKSVAGPNGEAPLEDTELNLFKTVTTSILGQQISWLAARSVLYKFCRHFFGHMPEKPDFVAFPREQWPFPTPLMVLRASDADLRAAGLSFAKIKYVKDLAARFVDGRLDVRQILQLEDEEACVTELSKVKGVGRWTSEMILMFALRKPNILPCGDLGVQKGMINFFLSESDGPKISVKKRKPGQEEPVEKVEPTEAIGDQVPMLAQSEAMPKLETGSLMGQDSVQSLDHLITADHGLCRRVLQSRADGNKIKGGQYLSPAEMNSLATSWEPYRSVACMFMWALVDT